MTNFYPINNDTNPYNISLTQQRFSPVSLGYLLFFYHCLYPNTVNIRFKVSSLVSRLMQGNPNSRIQEIFTVVTKVFSGKWRLCSL